MKGIVSRSQLRVTLLWALPFVVMNGCALFNYKADRLAFLPSYDEVEKPLYSVLPLDLTNIQGFVPLGGVSPPGHVFPLDHHYFYLAQPAKQVAVYSPGAGWITDVSVQQHVTAGFADYQLKLYSWREVSANFMHLSELAPNILDEVGSFALGGKCEVYSTGGETYRLCRKEVVIKVSPGQVIGKAGGNPGQLALDFGVYDTRVAQAFANIERFRPFGFDYPYAVSSVNYFDPTDQANLTAIVGSYDGSQKRTVEPLGGTIQQDIPGTAQGLWFKSGEPTYPEDPHLALVHDNIDPTIPHFSIGTSLPGLASGMYTFSTLSSGLSNRDFSEMTPDGNAYVFTDPQHSSSTVILVKMMNDETIRVEAQTTVDGPPWLFTSNHVDYVR